MELARVVFWGSWALIGYTYVAFPVLLALCARLFGRPEQRPEEAEVPDQCLPRVAMVVAAHNEAGVLPAKLTNTWNLDYPRDLFELYVGSDGSEDATPQLLHACTDARLRSFPFSQRRGKISVLNDLLQEVDADIVVMSDANTMFAPDAIRRLIRPFRDPRVGCVSGELSLEQEGGVSGEGLYWKYEGWIKRQEGRLGFLIGCNGGIFAIRRELYEALPPSTIVEDFVLTMRILERGYQVRFEPEARATEPACPSAQAEMKRKVRIGAGGWQALQLTHALLHPRYGLGAFAFWGHKVMRWLVPQLFLLALVANCALLRQDLYRLLLGLQAVGALSAIWAYKMPRNRSLPRWTRPVSYFFLMNYALFCGFLRFLFGKQRVTWERAGHASSANAASTHAVIHLTAERPETGVSVGEAEPAVARKSSYEPDRDRIPRE